MKFTSNASQVAKSILNRAKGTRDAVRAGLTRVALSINAKQVENLSGKGTDEAGGFPVPVRTGHLRRSADIEVNETEAYVMNTAEYAAAIHKRNGPFLGDATKRMQLSRQFAAAYKKELRA